MALVWVVPSAKTEPLTSAPLPQRALKPGRIRTAPADAVQRRTRGSGRRDTYVLGYVRKNGTYVRPHERAAPRLRNDNSFSHSGGESSSSRSALPRRYSGASSYRYRSAGGMAPNHGERQRSRAARNAFQRSNPCPSTGKRSGSCPGYVVDHRNALACGGADTPLNMQWQTVAQARLKDKTERAGCRYDLTKIEAQTALVLYYDGMEDLLFRFHFSG